MLHRALASLLCLLGIVAIGLGVASATLWRASDTLVATATAAEGTTLMVTDPGVLDLAAPEVTVEAGTDGGGTVVLAVGRTADVEAWVGEDAVTRVTGLADRRTLATASEAAGPRSTEPSATDQAAPTPTPSESAAAPAEDAAATAAPDPSGSDLWVLERSGEGSASVAWPDVDGRWSLLVATVGEGATPPTLTLTWPQEVSTPWLLPGVLVGAVLLLAGLTWWALLLRRGRRTGAPVATVPATATPTDPSAASTSGQVASVQEVPTAPLTRRALREAEERRARESQAEREAVRARFPLRIPGPARPAAGTGTADADAAPGGAAAVEAPAGAAGAAPAGPARVPTPVPGATPPSPRPAQPTPTQPGTAQGGGAPRGAAQPTPAQPGTAPGGGAPRGGAQAAPTPAGPKPAGPAPVDAAGPDAPAGGGSGGWAGRLAGRWRRQDTAPGRAEDGSPDEPPAAPDQPEPEEIPTALPSASADAWRRAWGFPSASTTDAPSTPAGPTAEPGGAAPDGPRPAEPGGAAPDGPRPAETGAHPAPPRREPGPRPDADDQGAER